MRNKIKKGLAGLVFAGVLYLGGSSGSYSHEAKHPHIHYGNTEIVFERNENQSGERALSVLELGLTGLMAFGAIYFWKRCDRQSEIQPKYHSGIIKRNSED